MPGHSHSDRTAEMHKEIYVKKKKKENNAIMIFFFILHEIILGITL